MSERIQKVFEDPYKSSKCESYLQSVNNPSISQIQFNNLSCVHRHYPVNENSLVERSPSFQHHSYATFYQNYNVAANFPAIPHASIRNAHQRFTGSSSFQGQSTTFQNPHYNNCVSNTTSEHSTPYFRNSNKVSLTSMDCLSQTINCTKRPPYVKTCPSLVNSSSYLLQTNNPSFSSSVSTVHPHSQRRNVLPFSPNKHGYVQYPMTSKVFHPTKGPKQLYCDICDKDFYSKERYDTHIENDHFPCGFPGCNYSAPLAVLNVHKLKHIKGENKNNILDDPLEIKKWIDARQRNFPKKTNEKIKDNTSPCAIERILRQQYMQEKSYANETVAVSRSF
ncbi:uncharacterized protein LOC128882602 isoform X2 [Hylaeus volcanicus]|uniref:uncharacterized protein LOC128882602 isoform X2 n=1 Tax=Hylaeus volcanicus TaxID=313075 RepID=UPI0023B7B808|nr:uncharacterized protein LOC128882602 isoform X2 [Hylaeus volcanicus]